MRRATAFFGSLVLGAALLAGEVAGADATQLRLAAPPRLQDSGLLGYVVPRFALKTGTRVKIVPPGAVAEAALVTEPPGTPVFTGPQATWRLRRIATDHPATERFTGWLVSDIGQRTVAAFKVDGSAPFAPPQAQVDAPAAVTFTGDARKGRRLAEAQCGRCHVVAPGTRLGGIGSTPSFAVLRTLPDWEERFQTFYVRPPHPAVTQITGITPPFPVDRPPPIVPVEIAPEGLEAILAYVATIEPADLGAPLRQD